MNFLSSYFGHHKEEKILYFVGVHSSKKTLLEVLKMSSFSDIVLAYEDTYFKDELSKEIIGATNNKISVINIEEIDKYQGFAVVFDHFSNIGLMVDIVKKVSPKSVVGFFEGSFDTFALWEGIKDYTKVINLAREINYYRNEVLSWEKNKESNIELSVIFPTYKVANYLDKCLETVTAWKAPYIEFLFVNDGSPDNSAEVIESWSRKDNRVKLLNKENGGCASAREFGIAHANGRYIGLVDPDDFVDVTMFKKLLSRALMGTYDISYSGYKEFYEESQTSKEIDDVLGVPYSCGTSDVDEIDKLIAYRRIAIWRGLYRAQFLKDNNIHFHTELKRFDDLPFKVETLARAKSVVSIEEYLYYYRMGRPGQDVSATNEKLYVHFDIFAILDEFFKKFRSSKQLRYYYQVKIQTHYWALSIIDKNLIDEYLKKAAEDLKIKNTLNEWKKLFSRCYKKSDVKFILKRIKNK